MAATTITRATWTDGAAGTTIDNARKNSDIYDKVDQMFAGGTAYEVFTFGGFVGSDTQPRASVYNSTTQSIPDTTETALTFDSEISDVGGCHSTVTNTSRLTVPTNGTGWYLVLAQTQFAANATGYREIRLRYNGTTGLTATRMPTASGTITTQIQSMWMGQLAATDYVEATVVQTSGGNLNAGSATQVQASRFFFVKLW